MPEKFGDELLVFAIGMILLVLLFAAFSAVTGCYWGYKHGAQDALNGRTLLFGFKIHRKPKAGA